jgi:hypothetical protein
METTYTVILRRGVSLDLDEVGYTLFGNSPLILDEAQYAKVKDKLTAEGVSVEVIPAVPPVVPDEPAAPAKKAKKKSTPVAKGKADNKPEEK